MRIGFLGTPEVAVPSLDALVAEPDLDVAVVITNPDRPRGRSGRPEPPPVKVAAEKHGIEVWQPRRPAEIAEELRRLELDVAAVVAYGAILPPEVLDGTRRGFVNLHFSLLPRWRGAAPVQHALRAGDRVTGLTTFVLDEGMDTGPIVRQEEVRIERDETAGELLDRLAERGAPLLVDSLRRLAAGEQPRPQPTEGATLAPKVSPEDVGIDWSQPAVDVVNLVRSANPAPGAHTTFRDRRLKVWRARLAEGHASGEAGTVIGADDDGPAIACGEGAAVLTEVQPEGKGRMDGGAFLNGYQPDVGSHLGR